MKFGARNNMVGTVQAIKKGKLMSLVKVRVPAESVVSAVMTLDSLNDLDLKKGSPVRVLIKAVGVILVADGDSPASKRRKRDEDGDWAD